MPDRRRTTFANYIGCAHSLDFYYIHFIRLLLSIKSNRFYIQMMRRISLTNRKTMIEMNFSFVFSLPKTIFGYLSGWKSSWHEHQNDMTYVLQLVMRMPIHGSISTYMQITSVLRPLLLSLRFIFLFVYGALWQLSFDLFLRKPINRFSLWNFVSSFD